MILRGSSVRIRGNHIDMIILDDILPLYYRQSPIDFPRNFEGFTIAAKVRFDPYTGYRSLRPFVKLMADVVGGAYLDYFNMCEFAFTFGDDDADPA